MKRGFLLFLIVALTACGFASAYYWNDWRVKRHLSVARAALKSRDPDLALTALEAAARFDRSSVDSRSGEIHFLMARAYRRQGKLNDVRQCLQKALQAGIPKPRVMREEWLAKAQVGQMIDAEPHLQELLLDPGDDGPEICEAYANGYLLSYRFTEAFAVVDAWQKDFPSDPQPHMFRGLVADQNSASTVAVEHFQKAFDLAPQRVDIRLRLANTLLVLRRASDAASHFQQLMKTCPNSPGVATGWGRTLVELGQLDKARDVFTEALNVHPNDYDAMLAMGQLELNAKNSDKALSLLQQAVALNPDDPEVRNALAGALQRAGRAGEAREHFEFVAKAQVTNLQMQSLRERVTANAKDLEARYELAELLRNNSNQTDRVAWLRSIIEIDPKHQRTHAALAEHYEKTGNTELAAKHRAYAESLFQDSTDKDQP